MKYACLVCGYDQLPHPPSDYMICPSCGTEFGYTDFSASHDELRKKWLSRGAPWHSKVFPPPSGWNPYIQLFQAGLAFELSAPAAITTGWAQTYSIIQEPASSLPYETKIRKAA